MLFQIILVFQLFWVYSLQAEAPMVTTSLGKIKGHYKQSYQGRTFSAFEGIPYAKAPVGDLRFEEPQPVKPWSGIWDATTMYDCIQLTWPNFIPAGNEDCLYINVYVPKENPIPNENLDVIVHIHGGAFMIGSPSIAGPEYLMDRDIIYINLNYRVGALGFLSTEDDVVSGNNGMKDQVLALKWIQENIAQFGGNPNSITLTGESAGAAAVHFHYFSRLSEGLFHRGVSHSGTALAPWVMQEAPLEKAKKLAASVGCNQDSTQRFIECLKQRSAKHIIENVKIFFAEFGYPFSPFAPVVEKSHQAPFLTDYPFKLLENGHVYDVPWINTVTTEEGIFPAILLIDLLDAVDSQWTEAMPHILEYNYTVSSSNKAMVAQKIKQFYFDDQKLSLDNFRSLIKLCSDRHFHRDFEKAARLQAKVTKSPVYAAMYGYRGQLSLTDFYAPHIEENYGVAHSDDAFLLYSITMPGFAPMKKLTDSDELMKELLSDIVTSFAKHSKPKIKGVNWEPVTSSDDFKYLFIQKPDKVEMASKKKSPAIDFWRSLPIHENENIVSIKDEL